MSAGRGIVHSERPGSDLHQHSRLHGLQTWIALPTEAETGAPSFAHYPADTIPMTRRDGAQIRVIIGEAFGLRSPVQCPAPALYVECRLEAGARLVCPEAPELGLYVVHGQVDAGLDRAAVSRYPRRRSGMDSFARHLTEKTPP